MKNSVMLIFNIMITTKNGFIFCACQQRDQERSAMLSSTSATMSIEKAVIITRHDDEKLKHNSALELGWPLKKGPMMLCKACSIGEAKQLVIHKHVDDSTKLPELGKEYFQILQQIRHHKIALSPPPIEIGTLL